MAPKTDVVVKLVLVFFISLLSFSVGTFIGKKYSDNQHQLSKLEQNGKNSEEQDLASTEEGHGAEKKSTAMSDEEISKLAEEFVADETKSVSENAEHDEEHATEHNDSHGKNHEGSQTTSHKSGHDSKSEREVASNQEEEDETSTQHEGRLSKSQNNRESVASEKKSSTSSRRERTPNALPKEAVQFTTGKFTVQVGSYSDESEAEKTAADLKEKGYSAFYVPATVKGKTWYRVSVGQFATMKEADLYRLDLLNRDKVSSAIVKKITE